MKILALDFDGVIVDSIHDGLFTAFNTYIKFNPKTKLFGGKKLTFYNYKEAFNKYNKHYLKFRRFRNYSRNARDYYYVLYAIENSIKIRATKDLDVLAEQLSININMFNDEFYKNRLNYQKKQFTDWVKLSPLFPHMKDFMENYDKEKMFISTSNIKSTVVKTLGFFKINFAEKQILDNKFGLDKTRHIRVIRNRISVSYSDIYFVDDQISHFPELIKLNVKCFLATWGYNNKEQREEAERIGVELVNESNFYERLTSK